MSFHLELAKNIFEKNKLSEISTVKKLFTVQKEGNRKIKRGIDHYNFTNSSSDCL